MAAMRTALIRVDASSEGYEASLHLDWDGSQTLPAGAPKVTFPRLPDPPPGFDDLTTFIHKTDTASDHFGTLGQRLQKLLIGGDIARELSAARSQSPVRLFLDVVPAELRAAPWELMRGQTGLIFTDANNPAMRVVTPFDPDLPLPELCWPLRVMVVVGSLDETIRADEELDHIRDAFRKVSGLVEIEVLKRPLREKVRALCEELHPHVFHFIGHGDLDVAHGGYLRLEQEEGGAIPWTAANIKDDLAAWPPRLSILNACHSGEKSELDGTLAAADALFGLKVPAVVAMQGPIRGRAAERFAKGFYEALAKSKPIDVAMARARVAITDVANENQREYALPSLTVGAPPERILDFSCPNAGSTHGLGPEARSFVDRLSSRRRLWARLRSDREDSPRVFAITGPSNAGKGSLVKWCLAMASLRGYATARAEFAEDDVVGSAMFLKRLAESLPLGVTTTIGEELGQFCAQCDAFELERLQARTTGRPVENDPRPLYEHFREILTSAATQGPLVVGIDGLGKIDVGEWRAYAVPEFVKPIAQHLTGAVRLIVALPADENSTRFPPQTLQEGDRGHFKEIPLMLFPAGSLIELATQWLRSCGYMRESFERVVNEMSEKRREPWGTNTFALLALRADFEHWENEGDFEQWGSDA